MQMTQVTEQVFNFSKERKADFSLAMWKNVVIVEVLSFHAFSKLKRN